jgi:hypothetical protein
MSASTRSTAPSSNVVSLAWRVMPQLYARQGAGLKRGELSSPGPWAGTWLAPVGVEVPDVVAGNPLRVASACVDDVELELVVVPIRAIRHERDPLAVG